MSNAGIYRAPTARVADPGSTGYSRINVWSPKGRLGRVLYIAYSIGIGMLLIMLSIASLISKDGGALFYASLATAVAIHGLISIQRAHDFNTSGLLAIVAFIPFVNFIFWFVPGTKGENRFGKKTPPNSRSAIVMASILVSLMIVGIHASIFLPRR